MLHSYSQFNLWLEILGSPIDCSQHDVLRTMDRGVPLEQENVRLRCMNLVVLPAQALRDSKIPPFLFVQDLQGAGLTIKVVLGNLLEHRLRKHYMTVRWVLVGLWGIGS